MWTKTSFDMMTLYKYLTTVERLKRVTSHSVSYSEITRQTDSTGQDSFKVELKTPHFYQTLPEPLVSFFLRGIFGSIFWKEAKSPMVLFSPLSLSASVFICFHWLGMQHLGSDKGAHMQKHLLWQFTRSLSLAAAWWRRFDIDLLACLKQIFFLMLGLKFP